MLCDLISIKNKESNFITLIFTMNSPGEPEYRVKGGTTVSGGKTVLSAIAQQSFNILRLP